ncbi:hypothetical protein M406DRAFT_261529 [Cryphonectria parasitica EP155]|uniref:Uncharacterized protein n=1 Tax=Cryphonectria parasitica (strain ATCC 38755 / EP155) TaxID=660469 RepID=A0A9P5CN38_CRYP1|nr:uncharacterized protein M406DRAFT_261529 [Cryphonectria parasitica EP155]KAF3763505.1 hypothetical protein M406DRAFT_261529 [Cryphonectria parasitica EP155]
MEKRKSKSRPHGHKSAAYLLCKNIKITKLSNKLNYKKLESFKILQQISLINYKLVLFYEIRMYSCNEHCSNPKIPKYTKGLC